MIEHHREKQNWLLGWFSEGKRTSLGRATGNSKRHQVAVKSFSQVPYFELKVPPPLCWAYSVITERAQLSHVVAIFSRDMGCERTLREMLNLDFTFTERSSYSLLQEGGKEECSLVSIVEQITMQYKFMHCHVRGTKKENNVTMSVHVEKRSSSQSIVFSYTKR